MYSDGNRYCPSFCTLIGHLGTLNLKFYLGYKLPIIIGVPVKFAYDYFESDEVIKL